MRMLIDLGDLDASRWVNQAEFLATPSIATMTIRTSCGPISACGRFVSSQGAVEARTETRQELLPGS
jgi:penicillin amidase